MRLLNIKTLELTGCIGSDVLRYAILSHRWGHDGVSLQDYLAGQKQNGAGYRKMLKLCEIARTGLGDKRSRLHGLSRAQLCLVLLSDVAPLSHSSTKNLDSENSSREHFVYSEWFKRIWPLLEPIAPSNVLFLNNDCDFLGWKHQEKIAGLIENATKLWLSWISDRQTVRVEDLVYCLLGLCGINILFLYGEGITRTFERLQLELIANSLNDSVVA
ncbi:hypothetical protein K431DRAFT_337862 [Polychaeton citri CBS 116435]|uniref:Uncharacterized protein n=1 Tax=Polychaeton citri CBS 116435 TaxID=1314669 RepID=A0A9P4QAR8_9PEZI|nr:hypothetical protein K431DRAFT_337862 [Polychaeton citri CBS 116435]